MPKDHALGILQALTLGITFNIDKQQWDLFRRTGTTHLMVISGSHIGLVAGLAYWLIKWLWLRCSRLCLYWPAIQVASVVAFLWRLLTLCWQVLPHQHSAR
nr:ComEC/Rec2 family competence protein [Legionella tunisiensis]